LIGFSILVGKAMDTVFGILAPILIVCGLLSIVPLLITQPIIDINGEVRQYMIGCILSLFLYWLVTFLIDMIVWAVITPIVWVIFVACQIEAFLDNILTTWHSLFFTGPSFILFVYCLSFLFSSAESASRQAFLILVLFLLIPMIIAIIVEDLPVWVDWIYCFFLQFSIYRMFSIVLMRIGLAKQDLPFYFEDETS
jgi:hypothetical protein